VESSPQALSCVLPPRSLVKIAIVLTHKNVQSLEPPAMTVTGTGIGAAGQEQPARRLLTTTQDISLLILAWLAALLICGMIIWIIAKIEKKLCRLVK